jgi:hypothetical protein
MFTRRILALAAALLSTLAITGTAADAATAASLQSHHFTVRAASPAATSTGPVRTLPDGRCG